jgi:hypothetical protein
MSLMSADSQFGVRMRYDLKYSWPNFNWFSAAYVRFIVIVLQAFQCINLMPKCCM